MNQEIFKDIADLVTQAEFAKAQDDFFQKNQDKFEDTEENKLEYTQVFEQYVMMCDELVTAKLKDKHDSEKVEKFYENFADNMAAYREKDELTVETLYGIIEFSKFKETILRFKKDNV